MPDPVTTTPRPRSDWLPRSIVSGFCASAVMLSALCLAYMSTLMLSRWLAPAGADNGFWTNAGSWTSNLAHNSLVTTSLNVAWLAVILHFFIGVLFALAYAGWAEPRLPFHSWQKGLVFAMGPFLLSVIVFFPLAGAGPFGLMLGAGPLPFFGNLILHAIYGVSLGILYGPVGDAIAPAETTVMQPTSRIAEGALRGGATGIVLGSVLGLALAAAVHFGLGNDARILNYPITWLYATCLMFCASMGYLVGVVVNQPLTSTPPARP